LGSDLELMKRLAIIVVACLLITACGSGRHLSRPIVKVRDIHGVVPLRFGSAQHPTVGEVLTTTSGTWTTNPTSFTYQWRRCDTSGSNCVPIAGATTSSYTVHLSDQGNAIDVVVVAYNEGGSSQQISTATGVVTNRRGYNLPAGVTIQPIDGGSCNTTAGPCYDNYYCSNGFTNACSAGWDNPSFVPILDDYAFYSQNSAPAFKALGLNTSGRVTGGTSMSTLRGEGVWAVQYNDSTTNTGAETVGAHIEEPCSYNTACTGNGPITAQAAYDDSLYGIAGRFIEPVFTWSSIYYENLDGSECGGTTTMTMQEVMTCTTGMPGGRHNDIPTDDIYWFAGQNSTTYSQKYCGLIYSVAGGCTAAQAAEASHYGDMVDDMRNWVNGGGNTGAVGSAPAAAIIETDDGLVGTGAQPIKPAELNWAVWDTIVHGARMIYYFGNTTDDGCGGGGSTQFGFCSTPQSGQSVSTNTQATDTNTLVQNIARIINSPFALNFASDDNGGYTFPTRDKTIGSGSQLDIMTKYYSAGSFSNSSGTFGNGFYIFVTGRGEESGTSLSTTITLPSDSTASGSVNYIRASVGGPTTGTLTIASHQISLTLPHAYDTYIIGPVLNQ
jgi:hypothetical protein